MACSPSLQQCPQHRLHGAQALLSGRSGPVMKKACDRPGYQLTYAAPVWTSLAGKYCRPCASGMRWQKPVKPSGSRSMRSFAAGQLPEAKVRTLYHSGKMINVRRPHRKPATPAHKSHSWHHSTVNSKAVLPSRAACWPYSDSVQSEAPYDTSGTAADECKDLLVAVA